jgi:hypothetical protein
MQSRTTALLSVLAIAACGDGLTSLGSGRVGVESPQEAVITGQVIGLYDFRPIPGDSDLTHSEMPIAQARVDLYLIRLLPIPPGSDTMHVQPAFVGSTTTSADGGFQFTVKAGFYLLNATPPPGSRFGSTTSTCCSVVLSTDDGGVVRIWLYPLP